MRWGGYAGWVDGKMKNADEYMRILIVSFVIYNVYNKIILYFKTRSITKIKFEEISNNISKSIFITEYGH